MTPEERSLVTGLFDRLAEVGGSERDPEAERAISDGLRRTPNAVYTLVQTALIQDEALKRAGARIRGLEAQLGEGPPRSGTFLGGTREATRRRTSVPTAAPDDAPKAAPADDRRPPLPMPAGPESSQPGGSFLGTAAAAAAGVVGGSLMLDSIRSIMGRRQGIGGFGPTMSSSATPPASAGNVARETGHDDTRSGHDKAGSSHGDDQIDDGDLRDHDDYQDEAGSGDFDEGSDDFDDGGDDFGGEDDEM